MLSQCKAPGMLCKGCCEISSNFLTLTKRYHLFI